MPRRANPDRAVHFRRLGTALALVLVGGGPLLHGSTAKRELALKHYQDAVAQRLDIETVPERKRTPELYEKAIQAFRRVYRTSPQSSKADDSLLAIADLYVKMGERFGAAPGTDSYQAKAVEAYEFLIHEYPYSPLLDQARKKADAVRQQMPAAPAEKPAVIAAAPAVETFPAPAPDPVVSQLAERTLMRPEPPPAKDKPGQGLSEITDVRYWSFPDSTRVVINLEAEPRVQAERLTEPDRIYFDLPNTKLSGERKFRTIAVNDALVKRIRMAQAQASVTRVVIDLNADVQQSTSVMTNPTRLVLELKKPAVQPAVASTKSPEPDVTSPPAKQGDLPVKAKSAAANVPTPSSAETVKPAAAKPAGNKRRGEDPDGAVASSKPAKAKPADSSVAGDSSTKTPAPVESAVAKHPAPAVATEAASILSAKVVASPILPPLESDNAIAPNPVKAPKPASTRSSAVDSPSELRNTDRAASAPTERTPAGPDRPASVKASKRSAPVTGEMAMGDSALLASATVEPKPTVPVAAAKSSRQKTVDSSKVSSKTSDPATEVASLPKLAAPKAADPTSRGERDLIRALGLKISRVVIDAGHGGHDTGTIGPTGLLEKDLTLDVATRLGDLIADRIGSEIVYTRSDDTFIPLGQRTAMANEKGADLFISVHANSSRVRAVRGIETYYLNLTGDREALETAARENASSEKTIHELQDLVSKITLTEKISESREFASQVQRSLFTAVSRDSVTLRNRGVRTAPFVVLIGARMPSVLAEISFLSNPRDEKLLKTPAYRQKIAEALYKGVAGYAGGLSSVEVAKK